MTEFARQRHASSSRSRPPLDRSRSTSAHSYNNDEADDDNNDMSTIPDPRSRAAALSPAANSGMPGSLNNNNHRRQHHPDLSDEVAALSTKLINAINYQTTLDDALSRLRMELGESKEQNRKLELENKKNQEILASDVWIRKKTVEADKIKLLARVAEERQGRLDMLEQKKKMEQELENLTTALFEEANKMVITAKEDARKEHEALQKKNDLLRSQLTDTEGLLTSQQEQLSELKHVMEQMGAERDDQAAITAPSSPGVTRFDHNNSNSNSNNNNNKEDDTSAAAASAASEGGGGASNIAQQMEIAARSPSQPLSFTHLLQPVLRTDLSAYDDFVGLVRTTKRLSAAAAAAAAARSRPPSGTHSSFAAIGLGLSANGSSASVSSIGTTPVSVGGSSSSPQTPNTPSKSIGVASSPTTFSSMPLPSLKETKFYKRVLTEDIEPTLRLDMAPGISWLARRSIITAVTEGSLVVEPVQTQTNGHYAHLYRPQYYACALCGDDRRQPEHLRNHRFRINESESAQRYSLCKYCLGRVRSTCDFLGFLRIVKDGHWRADDEDAEKAAWEESVRLREQMFWSRIGGGVISLAQSSTSGHSSGTASAAAADSRSPRISQEEEAEEEEEGGGGGGGGKEGDDAASAREVTSAKTPELEISEPEDEDISDRGQETQTPHGKDGLPVTATTTRTTSNRTSTQTLRGGDGDGDGGAADKDDTASATTKRLSLQIPGAF